MKMLNVMEAGLVFLIFWRETQTINEENQLKTAEKLRKMESNQEEIDEIEKIFKYLK